MADSANILSVLAALQQGTSAQPSNYPSGNFPAVRADFVAPNAFPTAADAASMIGEPAPAQSAPQAAAQAARPIIPASVFR
jgi:hypothetical protein